MLECVCADACQVSNSKSGHGNKSVDPLLVQLQPQQQLMGHVHVGCLHGRGSILAQQCELPAMFMAAPCACPSIFTVSVAGKVVLWGVARVKQQVQAKLLSSWLEGFLFLL